MDKRRLLSLDGLDDALDSARELLGIGGGNVLRLLCASCCVPPPDWGLDHNVHGGTGFGDKAYSRMTAVPALLLEEPGTCGCIVVSVSIPELRVVVTDGP